MYNQLIVRDKNISIIMKKLKQYGIVIVPDYIAKNNIKELSKEFDNFFISNSEAIYLKHKHPTNVNGKVARAKRDKLNGEFKLTKNIFSSNFMRKIVEKYYAPHEYKLNDDIFITHEKGCVTPILPWHFDRTQSLKFYIYLEDTNQRNGAFEYVPGSHNEGHYRASYHLLKGLDIRNLPNDIPADEILYPVTIEGKAGDLIIFDPDGFHRGGIVEDGQERKIMRGHSHPIGDTTERIIGDNFKSKAEKTRDDQFPLKNKL